MAGISEMRPITAGKGYDGNEYNINLKVAVDKKFKIPKGFMTEFIEEVDKEKSDKVKTYSIDNLTVTENDIAQYDAWIEDKSKIPGLLSLFNNEEDYSDFMSNYKDTHLTLENDPAVMNVNKTFSLVNNEDYKFVIDTDSWQGGPNGLDFDHVIGSLLFSVTYAHLFHLCTTDYAAHIALNEYYDEMPEKADALAEKFLADNDSATFVNAIIPGLNPVDYFERLRKYVNTFEQNMSVDTDESAYASLIDDILNLITGTLYKLKRLAIDKKTSSTVVVED